MSLSKVSTNLYDLIKDKNEDAINLEFTRAIEGLENKPLESISAACNILESICKVYIEEEKLELPTKQDLRNLWKVVSKDLQFDVNRLQDDDLKKIISGLFSIVDGVFLFENSWKFCSRTRKTTFTFQNLDMLD